MTCGDWRNKERLAVWVQREKTGEFAQEGGKHNIQTLLSFTPSNVSNTKRSLDPPTR